MQITSYSNKLFSFSVNMPLFSTFPFDADFPFDAERTER